MEQVTSGSPSADPPPALRLTRPQSLPNAVAAGAGGALPSPSACPPGTRQHPYGAVRLRFVAAAAASSRITATRRMELIMGVVDDAEDTARSAAREATRTVEDSVDRVKDKADEITAEAKVKTAEVELDSVSHRSRAKKSLRGD